MLTMRIQCNVSLDRTVTLKLPDQIKPGLHELVLVVDKTGQKEDIDTDTEKLMKFSGAVSTFSGVDGVKYQHSLRDEWS